MSPDNIQLSMNSSLEKKTKPANIETAAKLDRDNLLTSLPSHIVTSGGEVLATLASARSRRSIA